MIMTQSLTKSNEWYTPPRYIEAAREVMESIDLDPASCTEANWTVKAKMYYKQEENGLIQDWYGNMWLNPPYGMDKGKSLQGLFISKLVEEYQIGHVQQAVLLSTLRTDARWFRSLLAYPFCLVDHQIMFRRPGRKPEHNIHGSLFVYLGPREEKFTEVFSRFGTVAKRVSLPVDELSQLSFLSS